MLLTHTKPFVEIFHWTKIMTGILKFTFIFHFSYYNFDLIKYCYCIEMNCVLYYIKKNIVSKFILCDHKNFLKKLNKKKFHPNMNWNRSNNKVYITVMLEYLWTNGEKFSTKMLKLFINLYSAKKIGGQPFLLSSTIFPIRATAMLNFSVLLLFKVWENMPLREKLKRRPSLYISHWFKRQKLCFGLNSIIICGFIHF